VETLDRWWLESTERQVAFRYRDLSDTEDDDDGNDYSKSGWKDEGANTGQGKPPVRLDQRGEDYHNPSEENDTGALEWLPVCSRNEFATELVIPLSRI